MESIPHLLVVDDNEDLCANMQDILGEIGYTVETALNGKDAIDLCKKNTYDLALVDIKLPDIAGQELVEKIVEISPSIEIIYMTGYSSLKSAAEAVRQKQVVSYETKPLDMERLLATLQQVLQRRQTAVALQESEERHFLVLSAISDAVYITDDSGDFTFICQNVDVIFGYSKNEIEELGNINKLLGNDIFTLAELKERGELRNIEYNCNDKSGKKHDLLVNVKQVSIDRGTVLYTCRDITERKRAEEERKRLFDLPTTLVMTAKSDATIVSVSAGWENLLGYSPEEMVGKTFMDFIHPDDIPESENGTADVAEGQNIPYFENRYRHKDGTYRVLGWSASADPETGLNYGVAQDITERAQMQEQLKRQLYWTTVRNSISRAIARRTDIKSIFRVVLNHLHGGFSFEIAGIGLYSEDKKNVTITSLFPNDHSIASDLSLEEGTVIPVQSGLIPELEANAARIIELPELHITSQLPIHVAIRDTLKQSGITSMGFLPIYTDGDIYAVMGVAFTNRTSFDEYEMAFLNGLAEDLQVAAKNRELHQELATSYDELKKTQQKMVEQERISVMGQMASGIAHDINNTLAPISLYTEALLESEEGLSKRAKRFLKTIRQATSDIESTVGRLREFYRKPEEETEARPIDLPGLFDQVIEITSARWRDTPQKEGVSIDVQKELSKEMSALNGVESEIREVLINLVINAVDAMPRGGTIILRANRKEPHIILEVEDTGMGMTEEQRQKCLEPFYTTKGRQGTGLGLSVIFGIMLRHQGGMEIDSKPDEGTTVRLLFPPGEARAQKTAADEDSSDIPTLRILCIDDDLRLREGLKEILEMDSHEVVVVENGEKGIEAVQETMQGKKEFDVVITDLGMPDMDGWEVAEKIKELTPDTPVLLLSGWGNLMDDKEEKPQDVDAILGKPPKIGELRQTFRAVLSKQSGREKKNEK